MDYRFAVEWTHRLRFCGDVLDPADDTLAAVLEAEPSFRPRVVVFVDQHVATAQSDLILRLEQYAAARMPHVDLLTPIRSVIPGETVKNDPGYLLPLLHQIAEARIDRRSYVVVVGGGAVLDAVGFAAAIAHRGVRLVRLPTTTLAQADSGVGVKNAVNAFNKKNFIGTFAPPWAVINSSHFLTTLPQRDWLNGFVEAVKVALVKDAAFFEQIRRNTGRLRHRDLAAAEPIIQRSAQLHAEHITRGGDPFELTAARPLDFGHWAAHRLEAMTSYALRHGEAVSIGIAIDVVYAATVGLLSASDADIVLDCLLDLGLPIEHEALCRADELLEGLDEFREHLGGRLTVTMLRGIGQALDVHRIDQAAMRSAIADLPRRVASRNVR